jgi:hypothetical protein
MSTYFQLKVIIYYKTCDAKVGRENGLMLHNIQIQIFIKNRSTIKKKTNIYLNREKFNS